MAMNDTDELRALAEKEPGPDDEPILSLSAAPTVEAELRGSGLLAAAKWQLAVKRTIDVVLGVLLLVMALPLFLLVATAVAATSPGAIFHLQHRMGRDGQPFKVWKFRSMHADADKRRDDLLHLNETTGPVFKMRYDPRITPVGRTLRKLSLDELPQLINVVRGEMSLVGPRPPLPAEYATYNAYQRARLMVQPGLTCIWQVSGRSTVGFLDWIEMDLDYIRSWSLRRDLILLLRTIPAVLSGRGAW